MNHFYLLSEMKYYGNEDRCIGSDSEWEESSLHLGWDVHLASGPHVRWGVRTLL